MTLSNDKQTIAVWHEVIEITKIYLLKKIFQRGGRKGA